MTSLILRNTTRFMLPLLLLFSVFLLLRGHHEPGGGFSGGLVGAAAFSLYALVFGVPEMRRALGVRPRSLIGVGLLVALVSGLVGMAQGYPLLTHQYSWVRWEIAGMGAVDIGTSLIFDVGVWLAVVGVVLTIIAELAEEENER